MKKFKFAIICLALLPLLTGLMDVVVGVSAWKNIGVGLSEVGFKDSILDSQVRFLGLVWFSFGVLLIVCSRELNKYANILRGALLIVFVGGIARVISLMKVGMPESELGVGFIVVALIIELAVIPVFIYWQYKVMNDDQAGI